MLKFVHVLSVEAVLTLHTVTVSEQAYKAVPSYTREHLRWFLGVPRRTREVRSVMESFHLAVMLSQHGHGSLSELPTVNPSWGKSSQYCAT